MRFLFSVLLILSFSFSYSQSTYHKVYEVSIKKLNAPQANDCVPVKVDYAAIISQNDVTIISKDKEVYSFVSNISNVDAEGFLFNLYTCRISDMTGVIQIMKQKNSYAEEGLFVIMLAGFEITYRFRKG